MSQDPAFLINHELKRRGLASLAEAGALITQLAFFVRDHAHFRALINACEPEERRHMYDAMEPYLSFRPKPLADLLIELAQDAEHRQLPTITPQGGLKPFTVPELNSDDALATRAVAVELAKEHLHVVCGLCTFEDVFDGITKADAVRALRKAGWRRAMKHGDLARQTLELCPRCVRSRAPRIHAA